MSTIAQQMFEGFSAQSSLEDRLYDAGIEFEKTGFDQYDESLELYGVSADCRLSVEAQRIIHAAGFSIAFLNHTDKWETHYHFKPEAEFVESKGWRVSYPHKRGEGEQGIWVETNVPSWPREWFETGYAQIKSPPTVKSEPT